MSEKIAITYVTSDNRTIVLSERNDLPESLSPLERKRDKRETITLWAVICTLGVYSFLTILQMQANALSAKSFKLSHTAWIASELPIYPTKENPTLAVQYKNVSDTPARVRCTISFDDASGIKWAGNPETDQSWMPGEEYKLYASVSQNSDSFADGINSGRIKVRIIIVVGDIFGKEKTYDETYYRKGDAWITEQTSFTVPPEYLP